MSHNGHLKSPSSFKIVSVVTMTLMERLHSDGVFTLAVSGTWTGTGAGTGIMQNISHYTGTGTGTGTRRMLFTCPK